MTISQQIDHVRERIAAACEKCNRNPDEVLLVAVTKNVEVDRILQAVDAGVEIIGENRVQDARQKFEQIGSKVQWHFVGHLQTNKVKKALRFADLIQSVDSFRLAQEIQNQAEKMDRDVDILIQVNTSGEESKYGFAPHETVEAVDAISKFSKINVKGLMTIGAFSNNSNRVRSCFRELRELGEKAKEKVVDISILSMGMTSDFELAIEEGSTMVRIGRSIFGERRN